MISSTIQRLLHTIPRVPQNRCPKGGGAGMAEPGQNHPGKTRAKSNPTGRAVEFRQSGSGNLRQAQRESAQMVCAEPLLSAENEGEALGVPQSPFAPKLMVLLRTSCTVWEQIYACRELHHAFTLGFITL